MWLKWQSKSVAPRVLQFYHPFIQAPTAVSPRLPLRTLQISRRFPSKRIAVDGHLSSRSAYWSMYCTKVNVRRSQLLFWLSRSAAILHRAVHVTGGRLWREKYRSVRQTLLPPLPVASLCSPCWRDSMQQQGKERKGLNGWKLWRRKADKREIMERDAGQPQKFIRNLKRQN